ncbi:MAG TPA: acetoacetate decarboxylase family protein [Rhodocyclaceae bacterium]|nr:acetoacetate decarboxylase family protein [Rhodocyclaceae bacterium]
MKRVSPVVALSASLLAGCGPSIDFVGVQPRKEAPAAVPVAEDVSAFLREVGKAYGSKQSAAVLNFLSRDFLYQGMDRAAFVKHLAANQAYLEALEIRPVEVTPKGEALEMVAYGMMPRGPLGPSLQLLPLTTGATLVKEDGKWKLHGNQQRQEQVLYRHITGIVAEFPPADLAAYTALIPRGWELPAEPLVQLNFVEWRKMLLPQTPYRLAQLNIRISRGTQEAWFYVEMPETDWLAVGAGRAIGFPKYVADVAIDRVGSDDAWQASVIEEGKILVAADYVADSKAMLQLKERSREGVVVFPKGQSLVVFNQPVGTPGRPRFAPGWLTVRPGASGQWGRLLPAGQRVAASAYEYAYPLKLVIPPLASLENK